MIVISPYSLFEFLGEADAVVNTINTRGYMGKGLAFEFALRFPEMELEYKEICKQQMLKPGDVWEFEVKTSYYESLSPLKRKNKNIIVYNMATKGDYRRPSKIEWIEKGVDNLKEKLTFSNVKTIVIPKLGAGLGKLDWETVEKVIVEKLHDLDLKIILSLDYLCGPIESFAINNAINEINRKKTLFDDKDYKNVINISRFRDILKLENIGKKRYAELLRKYY